MRSAKDNLVCHTIVKPSRHRGVTLIYEFPVLCITMQYSTIMGAADNVQRADVEDMRQEPVGTTTTFGSCFIEQKGYGLSRLRCDSAQVLL